MRIHQGCDRIENLFKGMALTAVAMRDAVARKAAGSKKVPGSLGSSQDRLPGHGEELRDVTRTARVSAAK